jgi:hypothetical protein
MRDGRVTFGFLVMALTISAVACSSVKELRSPIVFRSPVVLKSEEEKKKELPPSAAPSAGTAVAAAETAQLPPAPEVKEQPQKERAEIRPAASPAVAKADQVEPDISMPADIPVFSSPELANYHISNLGKIQVSAPSDPGFTKEQALKRLKIAAYKRYGSSAQGLTNIELKESEGENFHKASGEVIMVSPKQAAAEGGGARLSPAAAESEFVTTSSRKPVAEFTIDRVQILSSDQVYQRKFRVLGKVTAVDKKVGFSKDEAIRELKIQAVKAYGNQAKGLLDVRLEKPARVFYYTKVRKPISTPQESKNYERASADVVVWE